MSADTRNILAFLNNDADFRTWGAAISDQFDDIGFAKTTDTGQIDWTTVARPAVNVFAGYEIRKFSDAMQATKPIFVKIEYGIGTVADRPSMRWSTGTGTNGAGTLTGQLSATQLRAANASKTAGVTLPSYAAYDGSSVRIATNIDTASGPGFLFAVDRTRDAAGAAVDRGLLLVGIASSSVLSQVVPHTGAIPAQNGSLSGVPTINVSGTDAASLFGTDVALSPLYCCIGRLYPIVGLMQYKNADITAGVTFTADWMGTTRTWMPFGSTGLGFTGFAGTMVWAMLYE